MTITDYLSKANKIFDIDKDSIIYLKQYYLSMYRYYSLLMYDKSYISDPTRFDEKSIRQNLVELNIKGCTSRAGGLRLNSKQIKFCLCINKGKTQQEFLSLLYYVLLYREYSISLDKFYEYYGLKGIKLGLKLSRGYACIRNGVELNKATARLLTQNVKSTTVKKYSLSSFIRKMALNELGIEDKEGQLDNRLSIEDEENLIEVLFGSMPPSYLNGPEAYKLYDWYNKNAGQFVNLIETLIYKNYYDFIEAMNNFCTEIESSGEKIVLVEGISVYTEKTIHKENYPIGYFSIIDGQDDDVFDQIFKNGYTGEGYTKEYLEEEGYIYTGIPIKVIKGSKEMLVFDIEQTSVPYNTFFKSYNQDYVFEEGSIKENPECEEDAINNSMLGTLGAIIYKEDNNNGISD